jgi:hypothetical protein
MLIRFAKVIYWTIWSIAALFAVISIINYSKSYKIGNLSDNDYQAFKKSWSNKEYFEPTGNSYAASNDAGAAIRVRPSVQATIDAIDAALKGAGAVGGAPRADVDLAAGPVDAPSSVDATIASLKDALNGKLPPAAPASSRDEAHRFPTKSESISRDRNEDAGYFVYLSAAFGIVSLPTFLFGRAIKYIFVGI